MDLLNLVLVDARPNSVHLAVQAVEPVLELIPPALARYAIYGTTPVTMRPLVELRSGVVRHGNSQGPAQYEE